MLLRAAFLGLAIFAAQAQAARTLPNPARGANLGSWFVLEPYMMEDYWNGEMEANGAGAEYEYVQQKGQEFADAKFKEHWDSFYSEDDFKDMASHGVNVVRIPVGFWIVESTKQDDDFYPNGGMAYLDRALGWAKDNNIKVLVDLHAVPGGGTADNAFAGRIVNPPLFWGNENENFQRAADALANFTERAHKNDNWASVVGLELLNEPPNNPDETPGYGDYLSLAVKAIRDKESDLGISDDDAITIVPMAKTWQKDGGVNPADSVTGPAAYDDHLYYSFAKVPADNTAAGHIGFACYDVVNRFKSDKDQGNNPVFLGEWWLDADPGCGDCQDDDFLKRFADAQRYGYDTGAGWIFWAWKWRIENRTRALKDAIAAGLMPDNVGDYFDPNVCGNNNRRRSINFGKDI